MNQSSFLTFLMMSILLNTPHALQAADEVIDLSGRWQLALDEKDQMIQSSPSSWKFPDTMPLPGTTDLAKKGPHITAPIPYHYHLNREFAFTGPAYYTREITIPSNWADTSIELFLERVMWQSRVWIDAKEVGTPKDSLNTPHVHTLGKLTPGNHQLTIRVDNRMIHPIGNKGHAYGNETQSTWNGVVGKLELRAKPLHYIDNVRVFPSLDGEVKVEVTGNLKGKITVTGAGAPVTSTVNQTVRLTNLSVTFKDPTPWSEFTPTLYSLTVQLTDSQGAITDTYNVTFGFRTVANKGNQLLINGKPAFMRGNLECAVFPKLGHPPVTVEAWMRIWQVYKDHNLNHARFHSWCPPEAAFIAADQLGIYLQVEAPIWMDSWMAQPNKRLEMDTQGYPKGLGKNDRGNDEFALAEIRRTLDTYGNHPSFVFFCIGNELGTSNFNVTGPWMGEAKKHDPRHLYAASTARTITPFCEFNATHNIPHVGWTRQHYEFGTNWDYEKNYSRATVPIIAHEIGQWPVYVDWKHELPKYTGPLKPLRLLDMAAEAKKNGLYNRSEELKLASANTNRILYRDEIESFLRTPSCRGFQLLGMQDFSGQGEALVGWLDSFYESKGATDPWVFRTYCAPTVPLLKLPGYIFQSTDHPMVSALLHHYGEKDFNDQPVEWSLLGKNEKVLASGTLAHTNAKSGTVTKLGTFSLDFSMVDTPTELTLRINLPVRQRGPVPQFANDYTLWVFPASSKKTTIPAKVSDQVLITSDWESDAIPALKKGKSVLLIANHLGGRKATRLAAWMPLYWSVPFFPGQNRETIGLRITADHPAFSHFPTPDFGDWLWYRLCKGAHGFDLTDITPNSYRPIAEPVSDFHYNRRLASLFEARVGKGKLLVCGYDLDADLPEIKQLRKSLTDYVASNHFRPTTAITVVDLSKQFHDPELKLQKLPKKFTDADLYINAAGKLGQSRQLTAWKKGRDQILRLSDGVDYVVDTDGSWRDKNGTAWVGKKITVTITPRAGVPGTLYVRFHDWNKNNRTGTLTFEGKTQKLTAHTEGKWVAFPVIREDTNDAQLKFIATTTTGPNLMITDIAFVPEEE